jgi:uncharacterized membrane protein
MTVALIAIYFGLPILFLALRKPFPLIDKVGVVTVSYIAGIIIGNLPFVAIDHGLAKNLIGPVVALSIPLLLFNTNLKTFKTAGPSIIKSFACAVVAVAITSLVVTLFFAPILDEAWKIGAMIFGVYTGGTMNMSSIGIALDASDEAFVLLNAADLIWGGLLLLFLLTIAKPLYARFLPLATMDKAVDNAQAMDDRVYLKGSTIAFLLSAFIVGIGIALSFGILNSMNEIIIYLAVTTFGIGASTSGYIQNLKGSFGLGNYLLYVFCVAIGSLANIQNMLVSGPVIIALVGIVVFISIAIHLLLARLLNIDVDSVIIASTAGLYGPPFIAPVAKAIGSPQLIPLGITLSLVGFAIGNYGGIALAQLLRYLMD